MTTTILCKPDRAGRDTPARCSNWCTALVDDCILVTYDARLASRARERGVEVLTTNELLTEFGFSPLTFVQRLERSASYADTSNSPPSA